MENNATNLVSPYASPFGYIYRSTAYVPFVYIEASDTDGFQVSPLTPPRPHMTYNFLRQYIGAHRNLWFIKLDKTG